MKKILFVSIAAAVFMNLQAFSEPIKDPKYISEKHDYAKLVLINGEELIFAFDESLGTGKGYDTLYADINFNSDLTDNAAYNMRKSETMNFDSKNVSYSIRAFKYRQMVMKFKVVAGGENTRAVQNVARILGNLTLTEKDAKWGYYNDIIIEANQDLNKAVPSLLLDKNIKVSVKSSITAKGQQKFLNISMGAVDEKNKDLKAPAITKNGAKITPLFTIENEKGEVILNASLKPG